MSDRDYMRADWQGGPRWGSFFATIPGTKAILVGLVSIHLLMQIVRAASLGTWRWLWDALSLSPEMVLQKFHVWQLVTAALLHDPDGLTHILFNGLTIYFFGRMVEMRIGTRRYLLFALGAAVSASIGYLLFAVLGSHVTPMVGASGAAMGMLAVVAIWYPQTIVLVFFVIPAPLWIVALLLIAVDLMGVLSVDSNIAHAAHLGGALYGLVYHRYGGRMRGLLDAVDRMAEERKRAGERKRAAEEAELRIELDRILDKVGREGMPSLTDEERRFLKEASERLRR